MTEHQDASLHCPFSCTLPIKANFLFFLFALRCRVIIKIIYLKIIHYIYNVKCKSPERTENEYFEFTFGMPEVSSQFWEMLSTVNPDL